MAEPESIRNRVSLLKPASPFTARCQVVSNVLPNGVAAPYPTTKTRLFRGAFIFQSTRLLKNKHQAVSQGARRFGKRSIFMNM
jgi:hypothetical protein